ncbi:hypothetical protein [Helicobacter sp. MIT 14-3879]|uniref:hypothetical protein n=1 Tax=Helicobacter sp. MIT 14-3879 TaxID=2040649 RepID=UPI000E1E68C8|nr:hypothetical protein [Helicobacter sp. MIT 14-3879]RDU65550.1 hypothetical protein CQA44_00800 [Helicobacter sp. MIT 14-3879]
MKKLVRLLLVGTLYFQLLQAKDDKVLGYIGSGLTVGTFNDKIEQFKPVNYPIPQFPKPKNLYNSYCKEAVCLDTASGVGPNIETGAKIRLHKMIELDLYGSLTWMYVFVNTYPNSAISKDSYYKLKKQGIWNYVFNTALNADLTLRIWNIGIFGGAGISLWGRSYESILESKFGDEKTSNVLYLNHSYHINAGLSYLHKDIEFVFRFSMPMKKMIENRKGNNGVIDYDERITFGKTYIISFITRKYF